ncbi:hypothetical protein FDA94_29275 [Herbidospora galbida]|uniref:Uncharacterized protein n=1 Tax=Herbidospora galbida TaxID=2575442 RepID=A0A4U3MAJ8_9ACTN|nr:hypothetical protein [Herbidospora galbida]TKK84707.1 hypothetical protein FDA94_29275 [Herbidospora galbida]
MYNDPERNSPLAPTPRYPERLTSVYERKAASNTARRGELRFQEGVGTDQDVPRDFGVGVMSGYETPPGHPTHNKAVWIKPASETLKERAHLGSAAWVEAPTFLGEFSEGAFSRDAEVHYQMVQRSGDHYMRHNASVVND